MFIKFSIKVVIYDFDENSFSNSLGIEVILYWVEKRIGGNNVNIVNVDKYCKRFDGEG